METDKFRHNQKRPAYDLYNLRHVRSTLEANLKRVDQTEDIFNVEESISKKKSQMRYARSVTPSPVRYERSVTPSQMRYARSVTPSLEGLPIYIRGVRRPLSDMLQPLEETPHSKIAREPWWWSYPSLRPHVAQLQALPSHLRDSYLSPVKSVYHWYEHPFRPLGPISQASYYYLWRRSTWENKLDEIDSRIRDALYGPIANKVYP